MMTAEHELLSGAAPLSIQNRRDWTRRAVHLSFGACALLVPLLGRWPSVAVAAAAVAYNAFGAPMLGLDRGYRRKGEGHFSGLTTYPLAVLLLLLTCPLPVAVATWGVLAVADPVAAAAGTLAPRPKVPGNPRKSLVGSFAALAVAVPTCLFLLSYMERPHMTGAAVTAGAAAAVAEALPLPIDDNLPIALATACALLAWGL